MYPSQCVDPAQVSPQRIALERCGLRSLGAGFVLDLAGVKIGKGKEKECAGTVSLWLRIPLTQRLEANPVVLPAASHSSSGGSQGPHGRILGVRTPAGFPSLHRAGGIV